MLQPLWVNTAIILVAAVSSIGDPQRNSSSIWGIILPGNSVWVLLTQSGRVTCESTYTVYNSTQDNAPPGLNF